MERVVNTVIIGAGPAGLACAMRLQKAKIPHLLVEKKSFPRDKTCGGLVTEKTRLLLAETFDFPPEELSSLFCDESDAIRLSCGRELLTDSTVSPAFHLVKRREFDLALANRYKGCGGELLENTTCEQIDLRARKLVLSNGDTVAFERLVVADGALSRTRASLGYKKPELAFSVEVQIPKEDLARDRVIDIHFGFVKNGYAWVFPSGKTWCAGLVGIGKQEKPYDELLKIFLASLGLAPDAYEIRGAYLPYGKVVCQRRGKNGVLLIGDAAGYADPITGEGLYFALQSGKVAAKAIASDAENPRGAYLRGMKDDVKAIQQGKLLQRIFYRPTMQKRFAKIASGRNAFVGFFCNNLVHGYRYPYLRLGKLCRKYKREKG